MIEEIWDVFPTPVNPREASERRFIGAAGKEEKGVSKRQKMPGWPKAIAKAALRIMLAALLLLGTLLPHRW